MRAPLRHRGGLLQFLWYELTKSDTDDTFAVPFDACMFVSRDTSPEFRERFDVYI